MHHAFRPRRGGIVVVNELPYFVHGGKDTQNLGAPPCCSKILVPGTFVFSLDKMFLFLKDCLAPGWLVQLEQKANS